MPLGIIKKNETMYKDMIDILDHHHKYVPSKVAKVPYCGDEQEELSEDAAVSIILTIFHKILFGGDQLTVARARGSQLDRVTSDTGANQLQGIIPVFEDWHVELLLLQVYS